MGRYRTIMNHPLTNLALVVYWIALAWYTGLWAIGVCAGMFICIAVDKSADWFYDRTKARGNS